MCECVGVYFPLPGSHIPATVGGGRGEGKAVIQMEEEEEAAIDEQQRKKIIPL